MSITSGFTGLSLWLSLAGLGAQPRDTGLKIEVHIYNYSAFSAERLTRAHELGHLLLGKSAHSAAGIMHTPWLAQDLEANGEAAMSFLPGEAKRIRAQVLTRMANRTPLAPEITVRVFNYAGIPPDAMARAEHEVIRIFSATGIQAHWLNCPLSPATPLNTAICPGSWRWTDLLLRLIPLATADRSNNSLGFSLPSSEGGVVAVIFYDRIEELTKAGVAGAGEILGYAAAHEVGHLLLGSIIHSSSGLMSSPWSREDVKLARLLFTRQQARAMRSEVMRRMQLPPRVE